MNGNLLHIRDEGSGRPLVLVHGWSCPGQFFDGQIASLRSHARCIVPDLPGHGQTGNRLPLTIESSADALYDFLQSEDLTDIVLCGWSMGALVVYSMIARHGAGRVGTVLSIDMTPKVLNDNDWTNGTLNGLNAALNERVIDGIVADWSRLPGRIAMRLFAGDLPVDQKLLNYAAAKIAECNPMFLQPMWASLTAQDFRSDLKAFPVPLHLASGLHSQLYGEGVRHWHQENVPQCHLHRFEKSGHAPHLEEPDQFNRLLIDLVRSA